MKRLLYIPGIWSLGALLPLCVWYLYRMGVWEQERCITMTFPVPAEQRKDDPFPVFPTTREARTKWTEFTINDQAGHADPQLVAFRDSLRELESREDTTRGIHVRFGPGTRYATIIRAIDICRMTVRSWELDDHELWTLHYAPPMPVKDPHPFPIISCGTTGLGMCVIPERSTKLQELQDAFGSAWTDLFRSYWGSWGLLVIIGVLALRNAMRTATRT